jgi:hypothetical protein
MEETFRLRRSIRTTGLWCGLGFSAWTIFSVWVATLAARDVPGRLAMTALFAGVPLTMTALSLWTVAAYQRERLTIQGDRIIHQGVIRRKEIDLKQAVEARWRVPLPGSVVLRDGSTRIVIPFFNHEDDDVARIVHHLRSTLRPEIQAGWNLFAYKTARRRRMVGSLKRGRPRIGLKGKNNSSSLTTA